jgi:hypothetical protein
MMSDKQDGSEWENIVNDAKKLFNSITIGVKSVIEKYKTANESKPKEETDIKEVKPSTSVQTPPSVPPSPPITPAPLKEEPKTPIITPAAEEPIVKDKDSNESDEKK